MTPEQRKAIAVQIGEVRPATDKLIGVFAESVANIRNHEHPSRDDLYCMNLSSYMGERVAPVLRRLLDAEIEAAELRNRIAELETAVAHTLNSHGKYADSPHCETDGEPWPCPTVTTLAPVGWSTSDEPDDEVHPPHPAPCRHPASPDCLCPAPGSLLDRLTGPGGEAALLARIMQDDDEVTP
ncbi:hypothetical protein [Streptomyces sp. NPDC014623]|uniref:hypothetical protein n=1 Tax=Streptomyces sp. NPDC014623 TaxID=3364875 RepID=UPI0036FADFA6